MLGHDKPFYGQGLVAIIAAQLKWREGCDELIRSIHGMEDVDSQREGFELVKPGFGLKDGCVQSALSCWRAVVREAQRDRRAPHSSAGPH